MKKIKYALMLATLSCLTLGACSLLNPGNSGDSGNSSVIVSTTVNGFDVAENIVVNEREMVDVALPIVTDENGNVLDVVYEVTTTDGGYVGTSAGKFFAADTKGYVIRYVVIGKDGSTHEKMTTVTVKSKTQLELGAEYDVFVDCGEQASIVPVCSFENPEYTYAVTNKATEETVTVSQDGTYVCNETGWYTVEITANAGETQASYSYEVYCREAMKEGEVEIFGADWEAIRLVQNYGTYNAKYTNTEESGVKDRFGLDSEFLMLNTKDFVEYANLYVNPRGDEAYYRQLAEEGYTHVSFWIYSECTIPHDIMLQLFPTKGLYTFDIGTVMPNKWVEMKVNLVEGKAYYESCFSAAVDYFKKQETPVLQFDNTNGWNGPNGSYGFESDMTFYISDVYAVKPSGIAVNEEAKTAYITGETVSLKDLFVLPDNMQVQYAVTYNGKTVPVSGEYTFTANGTYEVSVIPAPNLSCDETVKLTVTDGVVASVSSVQKERVGGSVEIDLSALGVGFTLDGETLTPANCKVTLDGKEISVKDNIFTADKDGGYVAEYEIPYQVGETEFVSYVEVKIDVWSETTKYLISDNTHMFASSEYCGASNWDTQPTYEAGSYTIGNKTGKMLKISNIGEALLVPFKPVYTKAYYESVLATKPEAKVLVEYYVTPQESGISARCYAGGYTGGAPAYNKWNTSAISLADFVEDYDVLSAGYDEVKYLTDNDVVQTHSRNENDYLLWMTGAGHLNKVTIYVSEVYIVEKVEVENDGIWNDLNNADAVSTTINPWVTEQATRNGLVSADEVASIGGQENALYTKVTANNGWFCYGGYQIKPTLSIKDAWLSYAEKDLVFDWYYDVTGDSENAYHYNVSVYGKENTAYEQNAWHTSRISMEDILADWDDVVIGTNNAGESSPWTPWIQFRYTTAAHAEQSGVVYLGNIRFEDHIDDGGDEGGEEIPSFWNDLTSTDAIKTTANRWTQTIPALPNTVEINQIGGVSGAKYLRVDGNFDFFMYAGYKILPSGEKADYEQYAGMTLVFDWYYKLDGFDGTLNVATYGETASAPYAQETWHTVTIAIDDLLAEWDNLIDSSDPMSKGTPWVDFNWTSNEANKDGVLYIGNIRLGGEAPDDGGEEGGEEIPGFWNDLSSTDAIKTTANRWNHTIPALPTGSEINQIGGVSGAKYLRVDGGSGFFMYAGYKILPSGEKAAYEEYTGYNLVFDWYYSIPSVNQANYAVNVYGAGDVQYSEELWYTVKIPMDALLAEWDDLIDNSDPMSKGMPWLDFNWISGQTDAAGVLYIGNIRVEKADETDPNLPVWNDLSSTDAIKTTANRWTQTIPYLATTQEINSIGGDINVSYLKVEGPESFFMYAGYKILPSGDKTAYEGYTGYNVVFDWYYSIPSVNQANYAVNVYGAGDVQYSEELWYTVKIPMDALLAEWDDLIDNSNPMSKGTPWLDFNWISGQTDAAGVLYIGNLRIEKAEDIDSNLPVWNDLSSTDAIKTTANRWTQTIPALATTQEINSIGGNVNVSYLKVAGSSDFFMYAGYKILPSGEKATYEEYADYKVVFDWYYDMSDYDGELNVMTYGETASTLRAQDTWHTVTISMSDLLAEWDNLIDSSNPMSKGTAWVDFNWTSNDANKDGVLYIGNIRLEKAE